MSGKTLFTALLNLGLLGLFPYLLTKPNYTLLSAKSINLPVPSIPNLLLPPLPPLPVYHPVPDPYPYTVSKRLAKIFCPFQTYSTLHYICVRLGFL